MDKQITDLIKSIAQKGYDKDPRIVALVGAVMRNPQSDYHKGLLLRLLEPEMLEDELSEDPFKPYPIQDQFRGDINMGKVGFHNEYSRDELFNQPSVVIARIPKDSFTKHLLACGSTGQGKTVLTYNLIFEFLRHGINPIIISFKRDTRHLIRHIPNLLVFRIGPKSNFHWNIFKGFPGIAIICRIFSETLNLGIGAESMMYEFCMRLLREDRLTISSLYNELTNSKFKTFRKTNWRDSLVNRLLPMKDTFWRLLDTKAGISIPKLQEKFTIDFELDQAGEYRSFWATLIPIAIYEYRIMNNLRGNKLVIPIIIDEALTVASKIIQRASYLGDPMLFQLIRLAREFGVGFIFLTSQVTALSDTIKANSAIKILMNSDSFDEVIDLGRSMNGTRDHFESVLGLTPGKAAMKVENIQMHPVTFPNVAIDKTVTNEELDEADADRLRGTEFEYIIRPEPVVIAVQDRKTDELKEDEKAFLWDVYNRPYLSIRERMASINI